MKKVTCYKADDGTLFETEQEAALRDLKFHIDEMIREDMLYASNCLQIENADDLIDFVKRNEPVIQRVLNALTPVARKVSLPQQSEWQG